MISPETLDQHWNPGDKAYAAVANADDSRRTSLGVLTYQGVVDGNAEFTPHQGSGKLRCSAIEPLAAWDGTTHNPILLRRITTDILIREENLERVSEEEEGPQ